MHKRINLCYLLIISGIFSSCQDKPSYDTSFEDELNEPGENIIEPAESFYVLGSGPSQNAVIQEFPDKFRIVFSRVIDLIDNDDIQVFQSGGDGTFSDANEVEVFPSSIDTDENILILDFTGHSQSSNEFYQIHIKSSPTFIDTNEESLDGDESGTPGEDKYIEFEVDNASNTPTFTDIQEDIFTPSCATAKCHSGSSPSRGLSLELEYSYANIVEINSREASKLKRVKMGNADASYLYHKINGTAESGTRMPKDDDPLPINEINKIRDWINAGALEN